MTDPMMDHYQNIKSVYNPEGAGWSLAIKEYCEDFGIKQRDLRSFIAKNIGGNIKKDRPKYLSLEEIGDKLRIIEEHGVGALSKNDLKRLKFYMANPYFEPEYAPIQLDNSSYGVGRWAVKAIKGLDRHNSEHLGLIKKLKDKYAGQIAYYLNNRGTRENEKLVWLNNVIEALHDYLAGATSDIHLRFAIINKPF